MNEKTTDAFWLRLDNAAKIYPAVRDRELTSVFRVMVGLKERVKIKPFLEAVRAIENRFPYYKVRLRAGFFWYYLEHHDQAIAVEPDDEIPCRSFAKHELMFRVLAKKNTISVEFSHILTDGTGATEFLKTLLLTYMEKCGIPVPADFPFYRPDERPAEEEYEDAYKRYFRRVNSPLVRIPKAFHVPFRLKEIPRFGVLAATIPLAEIKPKAKELGVTLTEYLTAVYIYSLQGIYDKLPALGKRGSNKAIRIEVPMNLRKTYPSITMRNFSLYVMPGIDVRLGHYTFEEIVEVVHHQMALETDKKLINKMISRNVGGEKNPFIRSVPLFLKSFFLSRLYALGTRQYSGVVTNLGKMDFPPQVAGMIDHFILVPPPPNKTLKVSCGIVGFDGKLVLSFGNITASKELERRFLSFLAAQGIPVKIAKW